MPTPQPLAHDASRELQRRLRARARRVKALRRRVGALTVALFLAAWASIGLAGAFGHSSASTNVQLALAQASGGRRAGSASATSTAGRSSSTASTSAGPTSITTRQS
jgi:hypothetical protein